MQDIDDGSATHRLFHNRYYVKIPEAFTHTEESLRIWGRPSSGDKELDQDIQSNWVKLYVTPIGMAMYYAEGCPIQIMDYKQGGLIYQDFLTHLNCWKYILESKFNVKIPPAEEIESLADFAQALSIYKDVLGVEETRGIMFRGNAMRRDVHHLKPKVRRLADPSLAGLIDQASSASSYKAKRDYTGLSDDEIRRQLSDDRRRKGGAEWT